jgi:uncharacterized OB-fold protein
MSTPARPLPAADDPQTAAFWQGTKAGEVRAQRCDACGYLRWPPAPICPECQHAASTWVRLNPRGTLVSYCVYHRALDPAFRDEIPYAVGYVQLEEGPRMYGQLDGPIDGLEVGQQVSAVFRAASPDVTLVRWTTASAVQSPQPADGTDQHDA